VDIVCGLGPFPRCRILTGSLDHTVKLWDLGTQSLITTFHFPKPIRCIGWDITERLFFASSPDGSIYQLSGAQVHPMLSALMRTAQQGKNDLLTLVSL